MAGLWKQLGYGAVGELAQAPGVRQCLQFFTREKSWINERHLELCRIPAPTFLEEKRAAWVAEQLRSFGYEPSIDRAGNVVALLQDDGSQPLVALTAHLDTVLAPRTREDITVDGDGRFRGPGVADNGAGLAALLAIARALKCSPPLPDRRCGLALVANVGEEGEGNLSGMRYLARQSELAARTRCYIVLDGPSLDHITWQALASRRYEVSFAGTGGHSWTDFGNANPVHALCQAIATFTSRCECTGPAPENGGTRCAYNFGLIEGGMSVNSIPNSARAKVDIRSDSALRIEEIVAALSAAVEDARDLENSRAAGAKLTARIKEIGSRPSGQLAQDAPLLSYLRSVDAHLGIRARLDCASTDANVPLSLGVPALAIGAGGQGGGAHTPSEWYDPDGRDLGLKRILLTVALSLRSL